MSLSELSIQNGVAASQVDQRRYRRWMLAIFVLAAAIRLIDVWRPIDGSVRESWRETDTAAIARNFYREGLNILWPRIDWRGDGPGYVESEFPIYPWCVACLYRVFGYHEELLRLVSYLVSLATCLVFLRLADRLLPRSVIPVAWLLFAVHPMAIRMASAVQPEPLMFLLYLVAVDAFIRWIDLGSRTQYVVALLSTTLAILVKVSAAHIGILFAILCLRKFGQSVFRRIDVWAFAVVSLGIPLCWYWHAHEIWLAYGNSLGMSNEAYVRISSGNFLTTLGETIPGLLTIQSGQVWMAVGLFVGMLGWRATAKLNSSRPLRDWSPALMAYFIVTGRTTGEEWASYYHIVSVPVACLLMGLGFDTFARSRLSIGFRSACWTVSVAAVAAAAAWMNVDSLETDGALILIIGCLSAILGLTVRCDALMEKGTLNSELAVFRDRNPLFEFALPRLLSASLLIVLAFSLWQVRRDAHPREWMPAYVTACEFSKYVPAGELIVASGPSQNDQHGLLRASNASYYFFWMDRKGFTLHDDEQTTLHLEELRQRGARYFVAERSSLTTFSEVESQFRDAFTVLHETDQAILFDLTGSDRDFAGHRLDTALGWSDQ